MSASVWIATGLGAGFSPVAPGTVGAVLGIPLTLAIASLGPLGPIGPHWVQGFVLAALIAVGVPICTAAAARLGGSSDPQAIVWDEIVTVPVVFLLVPAQRLWQPWVLVAGYLLHRLFDVTKPPPCRQLERLPQGLGIMADDLGAALYACAALNALLWVVGTWHGA